MDAPPPSVPLWDYVGYLPIETRSDLLLVSAPSYGNVGPAAARMLIDEAKLPLIATIQSDLFAPAATAWDGVVTGPMQVWGKPMPSGPDHRGGGLLLLNIDVPVGLAAWMPLARFVMEWAKGIETALVVTLEGRPRGEGAQALSAASNLAGEELARKLDVEMRHASLVGMAPAFLVHGNRVGVPVVSLFADADRAEGDPRAAIDVLQALAPFVPALALTSENLRERAAEVAKRVAEEQARLLRETRLVEERGVRGYA